MAILKFKKQIFSFILAFLSVFMSFSYCLLKPVPVNAEATTTAIELWQLFAGLLGSWGIADEHSMNMFSSPDASYQDYKGAQDFSIGQMNDFQRFINAHSHDTSVAEARWKGFIYNLKHGKVDLASDVGQLFSDWISKVSEKAQSAWNDYINTQSFDKSKYKDLVDSNGYMTRDFIFKVYCALYPEKVPKDQLNNPGYILDGYYAYWGCMVSNYSIGPKCFFAYRNSEGKIVVTFLSPDKPFVTVGDRGSGAGSDWSGPYAYVPDLSNCIFYYSSVPVYATDDKEHKVDLREKYKSPDILAPAQEKQLPSVISEHGSNLPVPQNDNDDNGDNDKKPLTPVTPVPINYPWEKLYPSAPVTITDPTGHGDPITIYKPSTQIDIKTYLKWSIKNYTDIKNQIDIISKTINNILKIQMSKTKLKDTTKIKVNPDFNNSLNLKEKFPFSLPWDLLVIFKIFNSSPEAPCFTIPYPTINSGGGGFGYSVSAESLTIDLNNDTFNGVAKVLRVCLFLLFAVGLVLLFWVK